MMNTEENCIGIDLCQHVPSIYEENSSIKSGILNIPPSVVLPFYQNEKAIFGTFATKHRRGIGLDWPPESRMNLTSEQGNGCGRVPLISVFAKLLQIVTSSGSRDSNVLDHFEWFPNGNKIEARAIDIIVKSAQSFASNSANCKVLVTPNAFQELVQEWLSREAKSINLHYIPKSMALALCWIKEYYGDSANEFSEGFIGHIRVCSFGLDEWFLHTIPLKVVRENNKKYIVPVFDPQATSQGLKVWGISYALMNILSIAKKNPVLEAWKTVLNGTYIDDLVMQKTDLINTFWDFSNNTSLYAKLQNCKLQLPHFQDVPLDILTLEELVKQAELQWHDQFQKLPENAENLMGIIIDGAFGNLSLEQDKILGKHLALLDLPFNSDIILTQSNLRVSLASIGAANFGKRLTAKLPTYQYKLIPIDIFCKTATDKGISWIPLIKADMTLDAGKMSDSYVIQNFVIEKGKSELCLILKRPTTDGKHTIYKRIESEKLPYIFHLNTPVNLHVKIKPGDGFAVVEIKDKDEKLLATLNWEAMAECDEPNSKRLGYLQKLNVILPSRTYWKKVQDIVNQISKLREVEKFPPEDLLKDLLKNLKKNVVDKSSPTESSGPISSDGTISDELNQLKKLQEILSEMSENSKLKDVNKKNIIFKCMGCLYLAADATYKSKLRLLIERNKETIDRDTLFCVGRVFSEVADIKLFYKALESKIKKDPKKIQNWILSLNYLLRLRENALVLETIKINELDLILDHLCEILENEFKAEKCARIAMACIRSIGFLLYRRKFESDFLSQDTEMFERIQSALLDFQSLVITPHKHNIIDSILKLLRSEATEADAFLLYQDGNIDQSETFSL